MAATKQLRKENEELRDQVNELKEKLEEISHDLKVASKRNVVLPEQTKSIEFLSNQHDDFAKFMKTALKDVKEITARIDKIEKKCDLLTQAIEDMESYSYRYNIKIYGVPMTTENESSEQTTNLCLKLFAAMGVSDCTIHDIDIAHRLPAQNASNHTNAIVCKFTRRITKERIMSARNQISNVTASQLNIPDSMPLNRLSIFDHLTPKQQKLFYEAKKYKESKQYKYCWAKQGVVFLRKNDHSTVIKLTKLEDLTSLQ